MKAARIAALAARVALALVLAWAAGPAVSAQKDPPKPPTLVDALRSGNVEQARRMVRGEGAGLGAPVNAEGDTLLHRVAFLVPAERQQAWVAEIVALGADVNARNARRRTPLHLAARAGQLEAARALIARGAEINALDQDYATPLFDAADSGRAEMAKALLAAGADPNLKADPRDRTHTPLTVACFQGRIEMVELLLAGGADINLPAARRTALDWARRGRHERIVELLTSRNAID
jgi:hypothetical protein